MTYLNHHRDGRRKRESERGREGGRPVRVYTGAERGEAQGRSGRPRDHEVDHGNNTGRRRSGDRIYTTTAISLDLCDPSTRAHTRRLLFAGLSVGRTTNHDSDSNTLRYEQLRNPRVSRRIDWNPVVSSLERNFFPFPSLLFSFLSFVRSFEFSILSLSLFLSFSLLSRGKKTWTKP